MPAPTSAWCKRRSVVARFRQPRATCAGNHRDCVPRWKVATMVPANDVTASCSHVSDVPIRIVHGRASGAQGQGGGA